MAQRGMQFPDLLAIAKKDAALLGADQKMASRNGKDRGDGPNIGVRWMDLPEGSTVQDQNSFVGGGYDQFRLRRIAQHAHRHCYQRRRRQISAHQKLPEEYATQIVL